MFERISHCYFPERRLKSSEATVFIQMGFFLNNRSELDLSVESSENIMFVVSH